MTENPPVSKLVKDFNFKLISRLKLFEQLKVDKPLSLLAAASKYGVIFVGMPTGIQCIRTESIFSLNVDHRLTKNVTSYPKRDLILGGQPSHLCVNADCELLAIALVHNDTPSLIIYSVASFGSSEIIKKSEIQLSPTPGVTVSDLQWNPGMANMLAVVMSDGSAHVAECKENSLSIIAKIPHYSQASCLCWSPKGKQVVIGDKNGSLTQYKPELKAFKNYPPPQIEGASGLTVVSVQWLSNFQFIAAYKSTSDPSARAIVMVVNVPKNSPTKYVNYEDLCYGSSASRLEHYFIHQPAWNILIVGATNSMEANILGIEGDNWIQWMQDEGKRAELPLTDDHQDVFNIGMGFDISPTLPVPIGKSLTVDPMPLLLMLSHDGDLCYFQAINTFQNAPKICQPPQPFPDSSGLHFFNLPEAGDTLPNSAMEGSKVPSPKVQGEQQGLSLNSIAPSIPSSQTVMTKSVIGRTDFPQNTSGQTLSFGMGLNFGQALNLNQPSFASTSVNQTLAAPLTKFSLPSGNTQGQPSLTSPTGQTLGAFGLAQPASKPAQQSIFSSSESLPQFSWPKDISGGGQAAQKPTMGLSSLMASKQPSPVQPSLIQPQSQLMQSNFSFSQSKSSPNLQQPMLAPMTSQPSVTFQQPVSVPSLGNITSSNQQLQSFSSNLSETNQLQSEQNSAMMKQGSVNPEVFNKSPGLFKHVPVSSEGFSKNLALTKQGLVNSEVTSKSPISSKQGLVNSEGYNKSPILIKLGSSNSEVVPPAVITAEPLIGQSQPSHVNITESEEDREEKETRKAIDLCQELLHTFSIEMKQKQAAIKCISSQTEYNIQESKLKDQVIQEMESLRKFEQKLKDTGAPDQSDINSVGSSVLELFGWYEKIKARERMTKNPGYVELMESQDMDPITRNYLNNIDKYVYYLESQIKQAKSKLSSLWDNIGSPNFEVPVMEVIYQSLVAQMNILAAKKVIVDSCEAKMKKINKNRVLRNSRRQVGDLELSTLAERLLDTRISDTDLMYDTSLRDTSINYIMLSKRMAKKNLNEDKVGALHQWHKNHKVITTKVTKKHAIVTNSDITKDDTFYRVISPSKQSTPYVHVTPKKAVSTLPRKSLFTLTSSMGNLQFENSKGDEGFPDVNVDKNSDILEKNPNDTVEASNIPKSVDSILRNNLSITVSKSVEGSKIDGLHNSPNVSVPSPSLGSGKTSVSPAAAKEVIPTPASFKAVHPQQSIPRGKNENVISTSWGAQTPVFGQSLFSTPKVASKTSGNSSILSGSVSGQVTSSSNPLSSFSFNFNSNSGNLSSAMSSSKLTFPQPTTSTSANSPFFSANQKTAVVATSSSEKGSLEPNTAIHSPTPIKFTTTSTSSYSFSTTNVSSLNLASASSSTTVSNVFPIHSSRLTTTVSSTAVMTVGSTTTSQSNTSPVFTADEAFSTGSRITSASSLTNLPSSPSAVTSFSNNQLSITSLNPASSLSSTTTMTTSSSTTVSESEKSSKASIPTTGSLMSSPQAVIATSAANSGSVFSSLKAQGAVYHGDSVFSSEAFSKPSLFCSASTPVTTSSNIFATATSGSSIFASNNLSVSPTLSTSTGSTATSSISSPVVTSVSSSANVTSTTSSIFGSTTLTNIQFSTTSSAAVITAPSSSSLFGTTAPLTATSTAAPLSATSTAAPLSATSTAAPSVFSSPTTATTSAFSGISSTTTTTTSASVFNKTSLAFGNAPKTTAPVFAVATTSTSFFGSSSVFGSPSTTNSIFGNTSSTTTSIFGGSTNTTSSVFGSTSTPSVFGTPSTTTTPSVFGTTSTTTTPSVFGTPSTTAAVFGQASTTNASSVFAGASTTASSIFGAANTTSSIFGTVNTTSSVFGTASTTTSSVFGAPNVSTTASVFGSPSSQGSSIFGATAALSSTSFFGSPTTTSSSFSNQSANSIFGGSSGFSTPSTTNSFFGKAVCSPTSTTASVFGSAPNVFGTATTTSANSIFGGNSFQQKSPFQSTGNVFGQTTSSGGNFGTSGGSLFGSTSSFGSPSAQGNIFQSSGTGNIFGGGANSGSPFSGGSPTAAPNQPAFGSPPSFQSAQRPFGSAAPVFGGQSSFGSAPTFGGSPSFGSPGKVFGSPPAASAPTSFGSPTTQQQSSTFENLANQQDTLSFGNLAQQQAFPTTSFGGSSFSSWRS